jgi:hypothetical protein
MRGLPVGGEAVRKGYVNEIADDPAVRVRVRRAAGGGRRAAGGERRYDCGGRDPWAAADEGAVR